MSRIRMAVEIHNDSPLPLVWARDELDSGGWTAPWYPSRASPISPGVTAEWRAEGDLTVVPTTGTEGRVWYSVVLDCLGLPVGPGGAATQVLHARP